MGYDFHGKWITDTEFYNLPPRNVFFRQLERQVLPCTEHRDRHILFRKRFFYDGTASNAKIYITADDYYKLYINGIFVGQGPAPSYHFQYNYNILDVSKYLKKGENVIAVHTLYQGLINRVWQSGDQRHGLILDLWADDTLILSSDETFLTHPHTAYTELSVTGYDTQFMERYDSNAAEVNFFAPDFDDSAWENAKFHQTADHTLTEQKSHMLVFEERYPVSQTKTETGILYDFGANYVGYLNLTAKGKKGDLIKINCGQEFNDDGSLRYQLRANCNYSEEWVLSEGESKLDQFDYKPFRYVELFLPEGVEITDISFTVRHYPFTLKTSLKKEFADDPDLRKIWELCIFSQQYGVQEVIQDCMEREKGFYLGDGCYTAFTNLLLTEDDSMVRKLIDDAFSTEVISDTLLTCMDSSCMQEIAEYPMILIYLVLWHYHLTGDKEYLAVNYPKVVKLLEAYRTRYEKEFILRDLDRWCVVEWPGNFQQNYAVDIREGKVCHEPHVSINAYYIEGIRTANKMAKALGLPPYRDEAPLIEAFHKTFYSEKEHLFRDGTEKEHFTFVGNSFVFGFGLCDDPIFEENILKMLKEQKMSALSFFCTFPMLMGLTRADRWDLIRDALTEEGTWKRMLREGATTTFEGWGKDCKWNISLFHLTMSYAAIFMADVDLKKLFFGE